MNRQKTYVLGSEYQSRRLGLAGPLSVLGLWCVLAYGKLLNPLVCPSPDRVLVAVFDIGLPLMSHLIATMARICVGYGLGVLIGLSVGLVMQFDGRAYRLLDPLVESWRPVPPVALVPFFILVFGFSETGKILLVSLGVALIVTVTVVEAVERIPKQVIQFGLVSGLDRVKLFRRFVIPAAWPEMRGGLRVGLALGITLVIVSELMGARHGLGYLISVSKVTLTTPTMLLCIALLGCIGWGLDRIVREVFNLTTGWEERAKEVSK